MLGDTGTQAVLPDVTEGATRCSFNRLAASGTEKIEKFNAKL